MGYTNYWKVRKPEDYKEESWVPKEFSEALRKDIRKLVKTAQAKGIKVKLNCCTKQSVCILDGDEDEYESFHISFRKQHLYGDCKARPGIDTFTFCKTARHGYDAVVKGVLMLLEHAAIVENWSFDGDMTESEFKDAYQLMIDAGLIGR